MKTRRVFSYGTCESCKNCKQKKLAGFVILFQCKKDKKYKRWCNKCHLYKVKRKYLIHNDVDAIMHKILGGK